MNKSWTFIKWWFLAFASIFIGESLYSQQKKSINGNEKLLAAAMFLVFITLCVWLIHNGFANAGLIAFQ
jgi:hypothetical protein